MKGCKYLVMTALWSPFVLHAAEAGIGKPENEPDASPPESPKEYEDQFNWLEAWNTVKEWFEPGT